MADKTSYVSPICSESSWPTDGRPPVSIIVITVNTPRLTAACLRSVIRNTRMPYELIVVSNSRARAIRQCLEGFPDIRVIQNAGNLGYTKAANQGILASRGQYLCFLNTDTLVPPRWIDRLLKAFQEPGVGAAGPLANGDGYPYVWPPPRLAVDEKITGLVDRAVRRWFRGPAEEVPWLTGFCLVLPRLVVARMGLFDERFYFGCEDLDYCLRLRQAGYALRRVRSLFIHHQGGGSSNRRRRRRLLSESRTAFLRKWETLLGRPVPDERTLLRTFRRRVAPRSSRSRGSLPRLRANGPGPSGCLLRNGLAIRAPGGEKLEALTALSDLEIFRPDPVTQKLWRSLPPLIPLPLARRGEGVRRRLEELRHRGLLLPLRPRTNGEVRVSVMMVAHNAQLWIQEAIESVLAQRFQRFELLFVDDGSTDATFELARRFRRHPQVRLLRNRSQAGIPASRNRALAAARGRYVAVCDADDLMLPSCLERLVGILEADPRAGWVYSDRLRIGPDGLPRGIDRARPPDGRREFRRNIIAHAGALIRKRAMLEAGGYNESLLSTEDYDLALRVARRMRIIALPGEVHYLWRRHPSCTSHTNPWAKEETARLLRKARPR